MTFHQTSATRRAFLAGTGLVIGFAVATDSATGEETASVLLGREPQ